MTVQMRSRVRASALSPGVGGAGERLRSHDVVQRVRFRRASRRLAYALAFAAATAAIVWSVVRGRALQRLHPEVLLGAAPLVGRDPSDGWDWRFGFGLVGAAVVAAVVIVATRGGWFWTVRLRTLTFGSALAAMAFATALALTDGADGLLHGAGHGTEYVDGLDSLPGAGEFVRTFVERIDGYSVHVRGHPPGFVVVLKLMAFVGLGGKWPAALLSVAAIGALVASTLVTVWAVAGGNWVRRTAPFLVVAPYAIWLVTSADAFFTAVGATGVAAVAVALRLRPGRALVASALGGALLGLLLFLTYLGLVFALVPAVLALAALIRRQRSAATVLVGAAGSAAAVVLAFRLSGFRWIDGARRTRTEYWEGTAQFREWGYFRIANLAVALVAVGPAVLAGLMRLRDRRVWLLAGSALLGLTASHLSQYTRGEVERIWLLFYPWLTIAAAALVVRSRPRSWAAWVGAQAGCAIVLQAALVSKW